MPTSPIRADSATDSDESSGSEASTSRRGFLATAGLAAGVSVAGCLGAVGLGGPDTLRVATWSGNTVDGVREHFAVPYEEENDVTVEVVGEWDQLLAKVRSAPEDDPPYDMMISYGPLLLRGDNDDLFMEIDRDNIPNTENIYPYVRDEYRTQYNKYGIETGGGVLTIVYDEERLAFDPSGWRDFLRDDFSKGSLEAGFWTDTVNIAAIMMQEMPGSEELYHEEHHDELLDLIRTLDEEHVSMWNTSATEFWEGLRNGTFDMGSRDTGAAWSRLGDNDSWNTFTPDVSGGYVNHYVRVRGTDGKGELIEDFMNHMLKTERAQSYHDVQFNLSTVQGVEIDERAQQSYPTSDDEFETLLQGFPNYVRLDPYSEDLVEEFNKIVNA